MPDDLTPAQRSLRAVLAAGRNWAHPENQAARAAALRRVTRDQFDRQVDPEDTLPPEVRAQRARNARRAHFALLALRSSERGRRGDTPVVCSATWETD